VLVQDVFPNTAAQGMGIQKGDVILAVNGSAITSMTDLRNEVSLNQVNDPVDVTIQRNGQQVTATNQFKPWPPNIPYDAIDPAAEKRFQDFQQRRLAQTAQELAQFREQMDQLRQQLGLDDRPSKSGDAPREAATGSAQRPQMVAWRFRYGLGFTPPAQAAAPVVAPAEVPVAPAAPAGSVPWRFVWRTWNPAHNEVLL
jgi:membrane-associated protease RseP (regulator of RpoE activity)